MGIDRLHSGCTHGREERRLTVKRRTTVFWLMFCVVLLLPFSVMAQEGRIKFGNLTVVPGLTLKQEYDDNIYLGNGTNDGIELEEEDWISHVMPALLFAYEMPADRGAVTLGYSGDFAFYGETEDNNWENHTIDFSADYRAPAGLILSLSNRYVDAEDPLGTNNEYQTGVPQIKRWSDAFNAKLGYEFDRIKIFGFFKYYEQDFDDDADFSQDWDDHELGIGFQTRFLPKTWGFLRYHYGERDYTSHPSAFPASGDEATDGDYEWHRVNGGLTWDAGAKLSGELNFGYKWRDYDNQTDVFGNLYDSRDTWIAATSLTYLATANTTLILTISREIRETGSNSNQYFEDTGGGLRLSQTILTRFTLNAGVLYSNNDYNLPVNSPREDDNLDVDIGLEYEIGDYLTAGCGYAYSRKDSNDPSFDYTSNVFMVSLKGVY
jgi:hypothetical protein